MKFLIFIIILLTHSNAFSQNIWEADIKHFEELDKIKPPTSGKTLFIGSSTIRLWPELEKAFYPIPTLQRGFGGSEVSDLVVFYKRIIVNYHPHAIVIYSGDNDLANNKSPETIYKDFQNLIWLVHEKIDVEIFIISLKPSPARWDLKNSFIALNSLIEREAKQNNRVHYINIYPLMLDNEGNPNPLLYAADGLHLSLEGYNIIQTEIHKALTVDN